ncbi:odorant receptor 33b-like [Microplitis mediator]|uniref:odorant receptor 33b-like n=1 Tax=Microplitis mediator TaxID=375433 RepID=UPI002556C134|nr:odorant receptor 33b-like [Microplitis mediator]
MDVLQENFSVLFYLGVWKPLDCTGIKSFLYNLYTLFITSISYTFLLSQILDLIISTKTVSDFTSNIFIVSAILTGCLKIFRFIRSRSTFINIINNFKRGLFKPANDDEIIIWNKYARITRLVTIGATTSLIIGLIVMSYALCSFNIPQRQLLYRAWLPYNYSSLPIIYWLSSMEQLATVHILAGINFSFDLIFFGTMLNICAQINILKLRYKVALSHIYSINDTINNNDVGELRDVSKLIREYTDSHDSIIKLFNSAHHLFSTIVTIQYCTSSVAICTSAFNVTKMKFFSFQFFSTALYINNVMIELFILCVSCNEVTLEFADLGNTFYDCQWYAINNSNKKSVAIMMTNTIKPIYFTCGYVIHLSLDSFTSVLKLSYSIYNVLQSAD